MFSASTTGSSSQQTVFSPFDCLAAAELTPAGLLQRGSTEVELLVSENVELRCGMSDPMVPLDDSGNVDEAKAAHSQWKDRLGSLTVTVTTHRVVFWNSTRQARFLHLSTLLTAETESFLFKSPKILLSTIIAGDLLLVFAKDKSKVRDDVHKFLAKAMERKQWEHEEQDARKTASVVTNITKRKVGVDLVMSQNTLRHQQAARLTDTAFEGDAESLLREATELVKVINRYVATLDRQSLKESDDDADAGRLVGMLQDMGMTAALTKADFKGRETAYFEQLARQLADFFRPKLLRTPVLPLTDVYCLFNRARGTNLLSPEDLLKAVACMKDLRLGMGLAEFPSGLKVLQADTADISVLAKNFSQAAGKTGLTALDVSRIHHVSAVLALEQLKEAETLGVLVRDETLESLRFFPNRFEEWATA